MNRNEMLKELESQPADWDIIIIGGGATGLGAFVDAASRGYRTLLLEQHDFAKATSSRSTKLIHGGLRYLQQGNISLVMEALKERGRLIHNAPHLIGSRAFLVPSYHWWEGPFYSVGLKIYDLLAGNMGLRPSHHLSKEEVIQALPNIEKNGLRGGTIYYDGQFDDARLALTLAQTGFDHGGIALNYMKVTNLIFRDEKIVGVHISDQETNRQYEISGKAIINATGIFCDEMRAMEDESSIPWLAPSQGIHLVFPREFLNGNTALLVPHTSDGRVLFIVPWHGKLLVGTTDTPSQKATLEPIPYEEEIDFILETSAHYLNQKPARSDILSKFAGLRPLFAPHSSQKSGKIARDHHIEVGPKGLISICGGKWTTYRKMAEDVINQSIQYASLAPKNCCSANLKLHGYQEGLDPEELWSPYGSDRKAMADLIAKDRTLDQLIHPSYLTRKVQVVWACRHEMALHVEDVLARRTRTLFLDAKAALAMAQPVAEIMAGELCKDAKWIENEVTQFQELAGSYIDKKTS